MATFRVWAPGSESVAVALGDQRIPMRAQGAGWWVVDVDSARAGQDYGFSLDGGAPLPDPRSPWQPAGVHGPSRLVDHHAFPWTDAGWQAPSLSTALIYELHVGTFTAAGTFEAAIDRLDHLVDLGVTHVELMPVAEFSGTRGWGYDGVDLFAPHHAYGGPTGLKRLVDACHARGLAVLLDVVYNHLGPIGNYLGRFGPYFTDRYATPWGEAVNFDGRGSDEVRRFVFDNALAWLRDYHVDGLRVDAVHAIFDRSALPVLEELGGGGAGARGESGTAARADRGERPQRSARGAARGNRRLRSRRAVERRFPPRAARRAHRRAERLLRRLRPDRRPRHRPLARRFVYDGRYSRVPRPPPRPAGRRSRAATRSSDACRTTIRSATAPAASARSQLVESRTRSRSAPPWCSRRRSCRCCSRARSGARAHRFSTSRITRTRARARRARGPAARVRRLRLGPGRDPRSAGPGDVRALQARLERAEPRAARGDPPAAPLPHPAATPPAGPPDGRLDQVRVRPSTSATSGRDDPRLDHPGRATWPAGRAACRSDPDFRASCCWPLSLGSDLPPPLTCPPSPCDLGTPSRRRRSAAEQRESPPPAPRGRPRARRASLVAAW